ncbi:hydrogen gas-evolving membrane-bound hydrogenase subunit E [Treponema sp. J25]|uniref:hydrogen gas-evolving membrane-bound hydrogenase subunit E n=1 Tax=Treponema sp. J25 TaxID=2094121 RepID=UPI0014043AE7|nr:hydrogen gas-evolving membrane-bound hydrogenase subunit E [Treponema sp. J25]
MKRYIIGVASLVMIGVVVFPIVLFSAEWPGSARDFLAQSAVPETGATNVVASIYLGYRLYDTLGETMVLLAALVGSVYLMTDHGKKKEHFPGTAHDSFSLSVPGENIRKQYKRVQRTEVLSLTVGKLSPVVLLFGWYVMFFGHQSPGGGFQGGVVVASGITFLLMGRRLSQEIGVLFQNTVPIQRIEVGALVAILLLIGSGLLRGQGFFSNPFVGAEMSMPVTYIVLFNIAIGIKVGAGLAILMILMLRGTVRDT